MTGQGAIDGRPVHLRARSTSLRRRRGRQLAGVAIALVTALVVAGSGTVPAQAASAGFDPLWAIDSAASRPSEGFAVDRFGGTYLAADGVLVRRFDPDGAARSDITYGGPGHLSVRGITVDDDLDLHLIGHVVGLVTLTTATGPVTLDGDVNASFLLEIDRTGVVSWVRSFDPDNGLNLFQLHQVGDVLVADGQFTGTIAIDGVTAAETGTGGPSGLAVAFDATTGTARWMTVIEVVEEVDFAVVFPTSGDADADSFALVGSAGGDSELRSAGGVADLSCTPPSAGCRFLVDLDLTTGDPRLAIEASADGATAYGVAQTATGYVLTGTTSPSSGFLALLDETAAVTGVQLLGGFFPIFDVEVDSRGAITASGTFTGIGRVGLDIGLEAVGTSDVAVMQFEPNGVVRRATSVGGTEVATTADDHGLVIGPDDTAFVSGTRTGEVVAGGGSAAVVVPGAGSWLAAFTPALPPVGSTFHPMAPTRILDSRTTTGGWNAPLGADAPRDLVVAGANGIPDDATAVVVNLTATDVSDMTYLTAWPTGLPRPISSILNVEPGDTTANLATVPIGADGAITVVNAAGTTAVVADVVGYYAEDDGGDLFHDLTPHRLLDSRTPTGAWNGPLVAGTSRDLTVAGVGDLPDDVTAITMSVTATDITADTFLQVAPAGATTESSSLNVDAGQTRTNLVTVPVGAGGSVTFTTEAGSASVVADAVGYYDGDAVSGLRFHPVRPTRVLDSRVGTGGYATPWTAGLTRPVPVVAATPGYVPVAIAANLTVTDATEMSLLSLLRDTVYPPESSTLVFEAGQTVASGAATGVNVDGTVSIFNQLGSAHVILDVTGYFSGPDPGS